MDPFGFANIRRMVTHENEEIENEEIDDVILKLANELSPGDHIRIAGDKAHIDEINKNFGGTYLSMAFSVGEDQARWGTYYVRTDELLEVID